MSQRASFRFPSRSDTFTPERPGRKAAIHVIVPVEGNCNQILEDGEYCGKPFSSTSRNRKKCDEHMHRKY